ncbi:MAG: FtsH protease activity modulator HflK [Armatimonadetes bacterium]|nr:FtsH protease activity modulator HflK [Armatimonadota bacterium]
MTSRFLALRVLWAAQPAGRRAAWLGLAWLLTGFYAVGPSQVAVVRVCGSVAGVADPGVWWRVPWPISRLDRVSVWERRQIGIGVTLAEAAVGRDDPSDETVTGDQNLVRVQAVVQFYVSDPRRYLFAAGQVDALVAAATQAALTERVAVEPVDSLMTTGRDEVRHAVQTGAQSRLDRYRAGVRIDSVTIRQVQPPGEVAVAFNDVNSARQDHDRKVNEAHGYANEVLPRAQGDAAALRSGAESYKTTAINQATGDAARFSKLAAEYHRAPEVTRTRLHLETVEKVAPRLNTTVVDAAHGTRPIDLGILGSPPESKP